MEIIHVIFTTLIFSSLATAYDLKCPEPSHRKTRASFLCHTTTVYSCLLNLQLNTYEETCLYSSDFVRPGQKYVVSGNPKNTKCSVDRYQPFRLYSSLHSQCVFVKSTCSGEGQLIFNINSTRKDNKCVCDYNMGYTFLVRPRNNQSCLLEEEDCSCYETTCLQNQKLTDDYQCRWNHMLDTSFPSIEQTTRKQNESEKSKEYNEMLFTDLWKERTTELHALSLILFVIILILISTVIIIYQYIPTVVKTDETQIPRTNQASSRKSLMPQEKKDSVVDNYKVTEKILQIAEIKKPLQDKVSTPNETFINVIKNCGIIVTDARMFIMLINQIVCEKMFPNNCTATPNMPNVFRIHNSNNWLLKAYTKRGDLLHNETFESIHQMKSFIKEITDVSNKNKDIMVTAFYIDIHLPVPILKGDITIADISCIGELEGLDTVLLEVMQRTVSYMFIVNARNLGGIHEERVETCIEHIYTLNFKRLEGESIETIMQKQNKTVKFLYVSVDDNVKRSELLVVVKTNLKIWMTG